MNFEFLSRVWTEFGPAIGNHLWQSTLFVAAVALLTLAFRRNRAGTRYGLWMAASVKFLVPFSLLIKVGSYFGSLRSAHEGAANSVVSLTIMQLNQPFDAQSAAVVAHPAVSSAGALQLLSRFAPVLFVVWAVGTLAVLAVWLVRWYRVSAIAKRATPLRKGTEAEIVARLQDGDALERRVEMVSTNDAIEPGIFGVSRPVLLWPAAMRGHVSDAHIESIVEHELCHVRRRDNLTAMVHMLVEALFWFHPFVWWIGGRLVEDRERACDEAVVESGRERRVYAESILKVCEFCVESPLPCVPGVSGADLKRRIAMIMSHRAVRPIGVGRKLLLVAACCLAIAAPMVSGALRTRPRNLAQRPMEYSDTVAAVGSASFSEVTIMANPEATDRMKSNSGPIFSLAAWKDGDLNATGVTAKSLIVMAYQPIEYQQVTGGPSWINSEVFDVHAKASAVVAAALPKMTQSERDGVERVMLQNMLSQNFALKTHQESTVQPIYELVVDNAAKLVSYDGDCPPIRPEEPPPANVDPRTLPLQCGVVHGFTGEYHANKIPISTLLRFLSMNSGRVVRDKTGLTKRYSMDLRFTPDPSVVPGLAPPPPGANAPSLYDALVEQAGLRLVPQTGPVQMLVLDEATMPAEK